MKTTKRAIKRNAYIAGAVVWDFVVAAAKLVGALLGTSLVLCTPGFLYTLLAWYMGWHGMPDNAGGTLLASVCATLVLGMTGFFYYVEWGEDSFETRREQARAKYPEVSSKPGDLTETSGGSTKKGGLGR